MLRNFTALAPERRLPDAGEFALNAGYSPARVVEFEIVPPEQEQFSATVFAADSPNRQFFCYSNWVMSVSRAFSGFEVRARLQFFGIAEGGRICIQPLIANIEFRGFSRTETETILHNAIAARKLCCLLDPANEFVAANGDRVVPFAYPREITETDIKRLEVAQQKRLRKAAKRLINAGKGSPGLVHATASQSQTHPSGGNSTP